MATHYSYPAYQLSTTRARIYKLALQALEDTLRQKAGYSTDRRVHYDLAAVRILKSECPRHLPYNVVLFHHQWRIVSQALRTLESTTPDITIRNQANALYQHWRRWRSWGYPSSQHT